MTKIFQLLIFGLIISCSPKIPSNTMNKFQEIKIELNNNELDYALLRKKFPDFQIFERTLIKDDAITNIEKAAIKLDQNQLTKIMLNEDKSCGFIKVLNIQTNAKMRVSYIYLNDNTKDGEKLADEILQEYQNGKSFVELAKQYSQDGNAQKGGDLDWFEENMMISDFTQAIRNHEKGDVFKVLTEEYGWYVISKTHEIEEKTELNLIEVKKENCG